MTGKFGGKNQHDILVFKMNITAYLIIVIKIYNMCKKLRKLAKIVTKVGYGVTFLDGSTMQNPLGPQDYFMRTFFILLMIYSSKAKYV
jgi:hypothetical protein